VTAEALVGEAAGAVWAPAAAAKANNALHTARRRERERWDIVGSSGYESAHYRGKIAARPALEVTPDATPRKASYSGGQGGTTAGGCAIAKPPHVRAISCDTESGS
jgi:hypothetical protein